MLAGKQRRMKLALASALSLLVGLGLGWLAFSAPPVVQTIEQPVVQRVEVAAPEKVKVIERDVPGVQPAPIAAAAPSAAQPAMPAPESRDSELNALRAQVEQLKGQLETELKIRRATEGAPIRAPAGVDERFTNEKRLVETFNKALKEAGFDKAQVSNVDCSEYPCIVFGNGFGERDDIPKLMKSSAMSDYRDDHTSSWGFSRSGDPASRFFAIAVTPKGSERDEAMEKRINFRVQQMEEVSRPPPPRP